MTKKQKKSLLFIVIAAVLTVICKVFPFDIFGKYEGFAENLFYLAPFMVAGLGIVYKAFRNLFSGHMLDENFLMTVATIGAFLIGEAFEAVMVVLLYRIGVLFESFATERSRRSISELMDIMPESANVERGGEIVTVDPHEVKLGEIIVVKAGERVPLDGKIISGSSSLNTAALTGESNPLTVCEGDRVISGSINQNGVLRVQTESEYENSTVGKILELIENSASKKARTETFISRFAAVYTPVVVLAAVLVGVLPPLFGAGNVRYWVEMALTFLVISCPCALVISVPLSFFGGMGCASRRGILVKGASHLEKLARMQVCLFDKTGTLTKGSFQVTAVHPERVTEAELLRIAAAAECYSDHPISLSLVAAYGRVPDLKAENITELAGAGVRATIEGKTVLVGNERLMKLEKIDYHNCHLHGTTVHIALDGEYMGHIIISDEIKEGAKETVAALKAAGIRTVMLTGDRESTAQEIAASIGIDEVHAELLPDGKVALAEQYMTRKKKNEVIGFVGDGINDAPVLMRSDVGISMGAMGSDAAIEAADIVIMDDAVQKIGTARKIARKTMRIVWENIIFFLLTKSAVLILNLFGLTPMWLAVFADVGVLAITILNAARAMTLRSR